MPLPYSYRALPPHHGNQFIQVSWFQKALQGSNPDLFAPKGEPEAARPVSKCLRRHRQLNDLRQVYVFREIRSGNRDTGHLGPSSEGLSSGRAMGGSGGVYRAAKEVCNLIVNREETLGLPS